MSRVPKTTAAPAALRARRRRGIAFSLAAVLAFSGAAVIAQSASAAEDCAWMDTTKTPAERANLLLDASTVQQQMRWLNEAAANDTHISSYGSGANLQSYPAMPGCVPFTSDIDGPSGIGTFAGTDVTAFPVGASLASSWSTDLAWDKGEAIAAEAFGLGRNALFGPGIQTLRTPLGGRNGDFLGEDSLLSGTLAGTWVKAMREADPEKPVGAVLKHYIANEQEQDRATQSAQVDQRTLREVYAMPYRVADSIGNAMAVMCSYNRINDVHSCMNENTITEILKEDIGFDGYVVTDNGATMNTVTSLKAGLDQQLSAPAGFGINQLTAALTAGTITAAEIREAAFNVVRAKIEAGQFDHPVSFANTQGTKPNVRTPEHTAVAREMAEQGAVLLKNDGILPLTGTGKTIAIIGPSAATNPGAGISATKLCTMLVFGQTSSAPSVDCSRLVSGQDGITARATINGDTVAYNNGADLQTALDLAATSDVAIVFGYNVASVYFDRTSLNLDGGGNALIDGVASVNPNTVVVLQNSGPVVMPWLNNVAAVLETWYSGEQGGNALASILYGDVNPSGKLPVTFPKALADTPTNTTARYPGINPGTPNYRQTQFSEGLQVGYKWYDAQNIDPLFEFGYGLSYTSYDYSDLVVDFADAGDGDVTATVSFTVENTGDVDGSEIPQVYLTFPDAAAEPGKRLVGFDRVDLAAGESKRVEVIVDSEAANLPFSIYDTTSAEWAVLDGEYEISVGASSRDLRLTDTVEVGLPTLDLNVTAASRCVAGKAQLTVTTLNDAGAPLDLNYASDFGTKSFAGVQVGKSAFHAFTTRLAQLPAGQVTVTGSAVIDGHPVTSTEVVGYAARSC